MPKMPNLAEQPLSPMARDVKNILLASSLSVIAAAAATLEFATPLFSKIPYHTSALDGAGWVAELLEGHPERIRHELGVHKHVFLALIKALKSGGIRSSRHVAIEEKLAIFLYTCVTGLSITHVGERFQRSNDTLSK
jgi:hypothetical protein